MYTPDSWIVMKITLFNEGDDVIYKVLGGWTGGYLDGDSWRINSGITRVDNDDNYYYFYGHTGSCYKCHKQQEGLRASTSGVWKEFQEGAANAGGSIVRCSTDDIKV